MLPCCKNCYTVYLDEEGNPIPEVFEQIFGEGAHVITEPMPAAEIAMWGGALCDPNPTKSYVMTHGEKKNGAEGCLCPCHQRGSGVMH